MNRQDFILALRGTHQHVRLEIAKPLVACLAT